MTYKNFFIKAKFNECTSKFKTSEPPSLLNPKQLNFEEYSSEIYQCLLIESYGSIYAKNENIF